tara:strand:+ start:823 stop:987 length:165 start_codon:yes stop_codon:yes gene_type:complete
MFLILSISFINILGIQKCEIYKGTLVNNWLKIVRKKTPSNSLITLILKLIIDNT